MNERIKELAEQAGFKVEIQFDMWCAYQEELERFVELVRQDERERIAQHFDSRIDPRQEDNGWYEPEEPAEIIRGMT